MLKRETIIISTSKFGNPVTDYYKKLAESFVKHNYKVIFIFDGLLEKIPENKEYIKYFSWKSKRPTKYKDFKFLYKLIRKEKTNIINIQFWFYKCYVFGRLFSKSKE